MPTIDDVKPMTQPYLDIVRGTRVNLLVGPLLSADSLTLPCGSSGIDLSIVIKQAWVAASRLMIILRNRTVKSLSRQGDDFHVVDRIGRPRIVAVGW